MAEIFCSNYMQQSTIASVTFFLTEGSNQAHICYRDFGKIEQMPSKTFFERFADQFFHPALLDIEQPAEAAEYCFKYDDMAAMLKVPRVVISGLMRYYPQCISVKVAPSERYFETDSNRSSKVAIRLFRNVSRLSKISTAGLNKISQSDSSNPPYHFGFGYRIDNRYGIDCLPDNINLDKLIPSRPPPSFLSDKEPSPIYLQYINDLVGFGAYAIRDIRQGETVVHYSGDFLLKGIKRNSAYQVEIYDDIFHHRIDASTYGNLARFVNHASHDAVNCRSKVFDQYSLPQAPNIIDEYVSEAGLQFWNYKALRDIKKGEQLLVNYGANYWSSREEQLLFLANGACVDAGDNLTLPATHLPIKAMFELYQMGEIGFIPLLRPYSRLIFFFTLLPIVLYFLS